MAITSHFIDESWKLQSRLVRFIYVPCPHTSAVICDALVDCLLDWNLDHKLSTLTLDNCSTNDALINDILRKLDKKVSEDAKKEIERIKEICADLVNEYSVKFKASGGVGGSFQSSESSFTNPGEVDSMSNYDKFVASESEHDTFKTELDSYLEEHMLPRNVNFEFDILSWWKNSLKYPILQLVARDVLAIPISIPGF
ncbi:hypothetical protein ACS0TY_006089 [Phlomoides rotata]